MSGRAAITAALVIGWLLVATAGADPVPVGCGVGSISPCLNIWPPAPVNLRQTDATEDSISAAWDEPDAFRVESATPTLVTIGWTAAPDPGVVSYTVERPSGKILGTTTALSFSVRVSRSSSQFHACVYASNELGQTGDRLCGTFTKSP